MFSLCCFLLQGKTTVFLEVVCKTKWEQLWPHEQPYWFSILLPNLVQMTVSHSLLSCKFAKQTSVLWQKSMLYSSELIQNKIMCASELMLEVAQRMDCLVWLHWLCLLTSGKPRIAVLLKNCFIHSYFILFLSFEIKPKQGLCAFFCCAVYPNPDLMFSLHHYYLSCCKAENSTLVCAVCQQ